MNKGREGGDDVFLKREESPERNLRVGVQVRFCVGGGTFGGKKFSGQVVEGEVIRIFPTHCHVRCKDEITRKNVSFSEIEIIESSN